MPLRRQNVQFWEQALVHAVDEQRLWGQNESRKCPSAGQFAGQDHVAKTQRALRLSSYFLSSPVTPVTCTPSGTWESVSSPPPLQNCLLSLLARGRYRVVMGRQGQALESPREGRECVCLLCSWLMPPCSTKGFTLSSHSETLDLR